MVFKKVNRRFWTCALVIVFAARVAANDNFGPVQRAAGDAEVIKWGSQITYRWDQPLPTGGSTTMEITIEFIHGLVFTEQAYSRLNHDHGNYNRFIINDPFKNYLFTLARKLRYLANRYGMNEVELALSFVQAIPYQKMGHYQRYAVEVLGDGTGDCSDTSALFAGILAAWGYGAVFLEFPSHLAIGVWFNDDRDGWFWKWNGRRYYFAETTGRYFALGDCPEEYRQTATITTVQTLY